MTLDHFTTALWITVIAAKWAVTGLLLYRRAWKRYPAFVIYVTCYALISSSLFGIRNGLGYDAYFYSYWYSILFISVLTALVLWEVFSDVFKPIAAVPLSELRNFFLTAVSLAVILGAISVRHPSSYPSAVLAFGRTMDRTLAAELVVALIAVAAFSYHLRITWRRRTAGIAIGLGLYLIVDLVVSIIAISANSALNSYLRLLPMVAFLCACVAWVRTWILPERELKPISPAEKAAIQALVYKASITLRNTNRKAPACGLSIGNSE